MKMDDEAHTRKCLESVAEATIRNRAAQGRHYPQGTAEAMVKAALEVRCDIDPLANARKGLDAMERVLNKDERA